MFTALRAARPATCCVPHCPQLISKRRHSYINGSFTELETKVVAEFLAPLLRIWQIQVQISDRRPAIFTKGISHLLRVVH